MRKISLIPEEIREYLHYDELTGNLIWIKRSGTRSTIGNTTGAIDGKGYKVVRFNKTVYKAHRIAWFLKTGYQPPEFIDHIDGNTINNIFSNLREATVSQNQHNKDKNSNNKAGYKGVSWSNPKGKWRATIVKDSKQYHLGYFDDPEEAHEAYCNKADELHGNFAHY